MSIAARVAEPQYSGAGVSCDSLRALALVLARILLAYCELLVVRRACIAWSGPPVMMAPGVYQRAKSPQPAHNAQSQQPVPRFLVGAEAAEGSSGNSMSDTENFECFGEGADADVETSKVDTGNRSPPGAINRHSWTRTSLRRTPPSHEILPNRRWGSMRHSGKRQIGSNVLASQLYRSSSFNSSGCGSAGEPADDMYSDVSLEEDVQGLNYKVHQLQQQVSSLADCQSTADERYTRAKAENAVLQARVHILEEQLRELEVKYEERIAEEQKRWREALSRLERDRDQQVDQLNQRLNAAEGDAGNLKQEVGRLKGVAEGLRMGADADARRYRDAQDSLTDLNQQLQQARDAERKQRDLNASTASLVAELQSEVERLRREQSMGALPTTAPDVLRLEELHSELNELRQENKYLSESHEELQAQLLTRGIEEGRSLLNGVNGPLTNGIQNSLAHELEEMTNDQLDGCHAKTELAIEYDKMQKALKEQQDVNVQLRTYIDTILLSIVENYPQLLEVKHKQAT